MCLNLANEEQLVGSLCKRHAVTNKLAPTACKRMVSGSISPPYSGYFSPFPHGTCSLSVSQEYLALPDGAGKFRRNFSGSALLRILPLIIFLPLRDSHPLWWAFPDPSSSIPINSGSPTTPQQPQLLRFGLFPVRSPLLRESLLFSLPAGT